MNHPSEIQSELPLTESTLMIMLSLAQEPRHGYAIMKDVETLSEGRVVLSTGTLYGALKRLLDQGWIARLDEDGGGGGEETGRPRKAYALTSLGQRILDAEINRIQALVSLAHLRTAGRSA